MSTTTFQRWGRITPSPDLGEARLYTYTHTGQARITKLDKHELGEVIDQANAALAALYKAEHGKGQPPEVPELDAAVGTIIPWAWEVTLPGWQLCDGTALLASEYPEYAAAADEGFRRGDRVLVPDLTHARHIVRVSSDKSASTSPTLGE